MKLGQRLLKMKEEAENAKQQATESRGKIKQIEENLLTDFACTTIEQAEELAETLENDVLRLTKEIEESISEFEETYGF